MKRALVVGMAKSGVAGARLLYENGWRVRLGDTRNFIEGLSDALQGVEYENTLGEPLETLLDGVDLMVLSPGVSMFQPFVEQAKARGIEIIGEIELGYRYAKGEFLCVTGTNGKTTCTALLGDMVRRSGRPVYVLGNIGTPISQCAMETMEGDTIVAETAALQLEGNSRFHAHVAGFTNISEDHLDRFLTMEYYIASKCKIFLNQDERDFAVLNWDDAIVRNLSGSTKAKVLYFSSKEPVEEGAYMRGDLVCYAINGKEGTLCSRMEVRIPGAHNLENALLCATMALAAGVPPESVTESLMNFPGVEHRLEFVCERQGVRYVNDSKGTNPDSTLRALSAILTPMVVILGGYDKHSTFVELFQAIQNNGRVKKAIILGETAGKLLDAAKEAGFQSVEHCEGSFQQAVDMAKNAAAAGDTVLLSPACASWDMFENFEHRGRVFKEIVEGYEE